MQEKMNEEYIFGRCEPWGKSTSAGVPAHAFALVQRARALASSLLLREQTLSRFSAARRARPLAAFRTPHPHSVPVVSQ